MSVQDGSTVASINLHEVIHENISIGFIVFTF